MACANGSIGNTSGVADNGMLAFDTTTPTTFAAPISGNGGVQQTTGLVTLAAANTYNGPTIISGGTLQIAAVNATLPGLVMRVPMAGPVGTTLTTGQTLPDTSGNGYNMQFDGQWGGSATFVAGRTGPAIQFGTGGGGQMLQIGTLDGGLGGGRSPTMIPTLNTWTASLWVDIPASTMAAGGSVPLWSGARNDNGDTLWYNNSGSFSTLVINAADNNWIVNGTIPGTMSADTWHMVTETVAAGQEKLYLDGTLLGTKTFSDTPQFTQANSCFEFGYNGWISWGPGPFSLQDFQLYGTAFSAAQVATLYAPVGTLPTATDVQLGAGVLDLNGASQSVASLSNYNGVGGTVTNTSSTSVTLTLTPAAGTSRFSGVIGNGLAGGQTSLVINGAGIVQLDGHNTFTGPTTVQNGTLAGTGTLASSVEIASGAALAPGANASGSQSGGIGTLTVGGLTLDNNAQLVFDITPSSNDLLMVNGGVSLNGTVALNMAVAGSLASGQYPLIYASGPISGYSTGTFTVSVGDDIGSIAKITAGGAYPNELVLDLTVSDVWTGATSTAWDTAAPNWNTASQLYVDSDAVAFTDAASGTTGVGVPLGSVTIAGTVQPLGIVVNNSAVAYTFSGPGSIGGTGTLIKQGPGSLEINMAGNTYSGGTNLLDGVLQVDVSSAADGSSGPLGTGPINLSGGTLQDNGSGVILTNAVNITGNVTLASAGAGSLTFDPQELALPNVVAISGAPTITVAAPVTINDQIVDGGSTGTLVVNGTSILAVNNANNTYSGGTNLLGGVLQVGASSIVSGTLVSGPLGTGPINLSGGTLQDDGNGRILSNAVNITGNVTLASAGAGSLTFDPQSLATPNTVSITGSPTITVAAPVTINDQIVNGTSSGTLVISGSSVLTVNNTNNTYTGGTIVQSGTLSVGPGASDGNQRQHQQRRPGPGDGRSRRHPDGPEQGHGVWL